MSDTDLRQPPAACGDCAAELAGILDADLLSPRFSPIASLAAGSVFGHLASVTGPPQALLRSSRQMFVAAVRVGSAEQLWRQSLLKTLARYAGSGAGGRLFVPIPPVALAALGEDVVAVMAAVRAETNLAPGRLVAVLPPQDWPGQEDCCQREAAAADACARAGIAVATASLGCNAARVELWHERRRHYLLLDEGQLEGLDPDVDDRGRLSEELAKVRALGVQIVAQGVLGQRELRLAHRLGVGLLTGDYIGRANAQPSQILSAAAYKLMRELVDHVPQSSRDAVHLLERLRIDFPPVTPATPSDTVFEAFEQNGQLRALAVVDGRKPVGLISRFDMIDNMARPYRHELYGRKSCTRFMDREPIVVDIRMPLQELTDIFVHADPRHLVSGFIITDGGAYAAMGSVQDLMREITAMQMEAARYANPLTQLPGNVPISQHIDNLLAAGEPFAVCYCDLDHFKPFNDVYGYACGDQVIALTARILSDCCDTDADFVGHLGGDDFIVVMRSLDWQARCERALGIFGEEILGFFSHDDVARGGYVTESRRGIPEFHSLTSLSIGVVPVGPGDFGNHLQVAGIAAEVKKRAKAIPGNSLYVNRRRYTGVAGSAVPARDPPT